MILLLSNLAIPGRKNVNGLRAKGAQCFVHLNRTEQFYTNKYTLVKVTKVALLSMCLVQHKLDKLTLLGLALVGVIWIIHQTSPIPKEWAHMQRQSAF